MAERLQKIFGLLKYAVGVAAAYQHIPDIDEGDGLEKLFGQGIIANEQNHLLLYELSQKFFEEKYGVTLGKTALRVVQPGLPRQDAFVAHSVELVGNTHERITLGTPAWPMVFKLTGQHYDEATGHCTGSVVLVLDEMQHGKLELVETTAA